MPRPTDEQLLEVSRLCIAYLHDKHSTELGLFRSSVAQTDVRALQTQIIQFGQNKFRDDPDPHLVAEVLQTCFKNLTYPLLHEVYQDIVHTDLDDEDMDLSETTIQSWITKLPTVKFHLTSALFRLLSRLAGIDESDSNLIQLAYCIAPSICRPINSAYMSIRHMEDLRKIRPVISFIMENYDEIFTDELGPASPIKSYNSTRDLGGLTNDKTEDISNMMSSSMVIDTTMFRAASTESNDFREFGFSKDDASVSSMDESIDDVPSEHKGVDLNSLSPRSLALIRPNLKLTIPTSSPPSNAPLEAAPLFALSPSNSMVSTDSESSSSSSSSLLHYTDAEWSILEALLMNTACSFLELDSTSTKSEAMQVSDSGGSQQPQSPPLAGTRLSAAPSSTPPSSSSSTNTGTTGPATQAGTEAAGPETTASSGAGGSQASNGGKHRRRKMVSDCKAMRVQIFDFEQEWTKKHNRIPKSFERGSMESVYTRYRKLKKEIRDISATDLQRALRGFMSRKRYGRIGPLRWGVSSGTTDKSLLGAAAGKSTAGSTTKRADFSANFFVPPQSSGADSVLGSQIPATLYASYREILEKKRDLKRRLKKFDEDFFENWGRNPKKSDKEVIRPLYQSYHEIKAKLDDMRGSIEASHGPLPEDLQEDGARTGSNSLAPSLASSPAKPGDSTGLLDSSAAAKYLSDDEEGDGHKDGGSKQQFGAAGRNNGVYSDNKTVGAAMGLGESKGYQFSGSKFINIESELEALQLEKRNLHSYLKVYERDFSRMHGRPVTKHADIQPVAHEYQRYKELKNLIKEKKLQAK